MGVLQVLSQYMQDYLYSFKVYNKQDKIRQASLLSLSSARRNTEQSLKNATLASNLIEY